jgi:lysyl-tRNA synthetase class 2
VSSPAFEEHLHAVAVGEQWLHTSPEFALKRVLAAGLPRIYSLGPCFREEEVGPLHTREFTMLEWYRAGVGYREIMDEVESLLRHLAQIAGLGIPPVERVRWHEAFHLHAGEVPDTDVEALRLWVEKVETRFLGPTIVYDYPASMAAFARVRGEVAERFELYWQGVEIANAFTELLDPQELRQRWNHSNEGRVAAGRTAYPVDEGLLKAVAQHPRAGGIAVGWDRLVMLLLEAPDIQSVQVPGVSSKG